MNVLLLIGTFDIGGQGIRIKRAFDRIPGWTVHTVSVPSYHAYPTDLPLRMKQLEELYQASDVIHVRVDFSPYDRLAARHGPKPVVIHHHGSRFRADPHRFIREQRERGAVGIVSTLDLWLLAPNDTVWLGAPYDVDALAAMR